MKYHNQGATLHEQWLVHAREGWSNEQLLANMKDVKNVSLRDDFKQIITQLEDLSVEVNDAELSEEYKDILFRRLDEACACLTDALDYTYYE